MIRFIVRCLAIAVIYFGTSFALAAAGASVFKERLVAAVAMFGGVAFFLGPYVTSWPYIPRNYEAKPSPPAAWRILGVLIWAVALILLIVV